MNCSQALIFLKMTMAFLVLCLFLYPSDGDRGSTLAREDKNTGDSEKAPTWKEVSGIFKRECVACHSSKSRTANLDLSSYQAMMRGGKSGAIVIPKNPKASLIMKYLKGEKKPRMPMGGKPLKKSELNLIERWIASGAQEK